MLTNHCHYKEVGASFSDSLNRDKVKRSAREETPSAGLRGNAEGQRGTYPRLKSYTSFATRRSSLVNFQTVATRLRSGAIGWLGASLRSMCALL